MIAITPDNPSFIGALKAAGLPHSDLGKPHQRFWMLSRDGHALGFAGIELYGNAALLRSVVVVPEFKGRGYGAALVAETLEQARAVQLQEAWLLTTTAAGFFEHLGWQLRQRQDAPADMAGSEEFASLCPASAACLSKTL